jgi:hypothetical protein
MRAYEAPGEGSKPRDGGREDSEVTGIPQP